MTRLPIALLVTLVSPPHRQGPDTLFVGRHCNWHLTNLRLPAIRDIADSGFLDTLLRAATGPEDDTISVTLTYRPDGNLKSVKTRGIHSPEARRTLETTLRAASRPLTGYPKNTSVSISRLSADGRLVLDFSPITCGPETGSGAAARDFMTQSAGIFRGSGRTTVLEFVLEPSGDISHARVAVTSGSRTLDSLALVAVHMVGIKPALVGRSPVRTLIRMPFTF